MSECGLVSKSELESISFFNGALGIERDINWNQETTLEEIRTKIQS